MDAVPTLPLGPGADAAPPRPGLSRRERREADEDAACLTLNTLLQAVIGSTLSVELCDGAVVSGRLEAADQKMNLTLRDAQRAPTLLPSTVASEDLGRLDVEGSKVRCVHLPGNIDAPELMRGRLRSIDQGRKQFRKRVRKQPAPQPSKRHEPIVSANVTTGVTWGS